MLAMLIGSRAERDASVSEADGAERGSVERQLGDPEVDELFAEFRGRLSKLFWKRNVDQGRPRFLRWAENLAIVYENAPESRNADGWAAYEHRVRAALSPSGEYNPRKLAGCYLTRAEVTALRGAVEAGRKSAAALADRVEATLRNWKAAGVSPSTETAVAWDDIMFYGTDVHFTDAIADVVELLAVDGVDCRPYVDALRRYPPLEGILARALSLST